VVAAENVEAVAGVGTPHVVPLVDAVMETVAGVVAEEEMEIAVGVVAEGVMEIVVGEAAAAVVLLDAASQCRWHRAQHLNGEAYTCKTSAFIISRLGTNVDQFGPERSRRRW
jgi:hypothetical protein